MATPVNGVNQTSYEAIRTSVMRGIYEGKSLEQVQRHLKDTFNVDDPEMTALLYRLGVFISRDFLSGAMTPIRTAFWESVGGVKNDNRGDYRPLPPTLWMNTIVKNSNHQSHPLITPEIEKILSGHSKKSPDQLTLREAQQILLGAYDRDRDGQVGPRDFEDEVGIDPCGFMGRCPPGYDAMFSEWTKVTDFTEAARKALGKTE